MTEVITIVGAGVVGMSVALELAEAGCRVRVFDRGPAGREASWAGGGILWPLYAWRHPESVRSLAMWSADLYPALCASISRHTGIDPQLLDSGLLVLDEDERANALAWAARYGSRADVLRGGEIRSAEPALGGRHVSAVRLSDIRQVRNPRLLQGLWRRLGQLDVEVHANTTVHAVSASAGRLRGLDTSAGWQPARGPVVIAAGAWTQALLEPLGIAVGIAPVKGEMLRYRAAAGLVRHILLHKDCYIIPRRDGGLLVGSTLEHSGFAKTPTPAARERLRRAAVSMVPALEDRPIVAHWAGLRPATPGGIPYIGAIPGVEGLMVCAGHFRNGLLLAPGSAKLMAALLLGRTPPLSPEPYAPPGVA